MIDDRLVLVHGAAGKPSYRIKVGDKVEVEFPDVKETELLAENLPLKIVYEDEHVVVVDKAAQMVVHPAPGHPTGTLINALLYHCEGFTVGDEIRPGLVHRIDKETSGLLVVAKTHEALLDLTSQFKAHSTEREYIGLCSVRPRKPEGTYDTFHGRHPRDRKRYSSLVKSGKNAVTRYVTEETFVGGGAMLRFRLETGRTHQIRVHCADNGHPILADKVYGKKPKSEVLKNVESRLTRHCLHAATLGFIHPHTRLEMQFSSELPTEIAAALHSLREG